MKGFLTLATGKDLYYILAHNLLLSYRYHTKKSTPFAILCDRENQWTADFDQVVIIDNPAYSFTDKMQVLDLAPYDETIFIEADCLIYRDLDGLWDIFKHSPDFGVLGDTFPLDSDEGWWDSDNLGELRDKVDYKMDCQGGVYFIRKNGKDMPAFKKTCRFIQAHYSDYHFRIFDYVIQDETTFTLASCVNHFLPVNRWVDVFAYYPETRFHDIDILSGTLDYEWTRFPGPRYQDKYLVHFCTNHTQNRWLYKREVFKLTKGHLHFIDYYSYASLRLLHVRKKVRMTIKRWLKK